MKNINNVANKIKPFVYIITFGSNSHLSNFSMALCCRISSRSFIKNVAIHMDNIIKINENIDRVKDAQLKSSLNNFLKAYSEKNK